MPPTLGSAYSQALQAPPPMPQASGAAPIAAKVPQNINPMTQQGDIFFLDPAMFEQGCKVGDEVLLKAKVQSKGSKVGLSPVEIVTEAEPEGEGEPEPLGTTDQGPGIASIAY